MAKEIQSKDHFALNNLANIPVTAQYHIWYGGPSGDPGRDIE